MDCNNLNQRENSTDHQANTLQHLNDSPLAVSSLNIQNDSNISCIPCAKRISNHFSYAQHIKSVDHNIMVLTTGVGCDAFTLEPETTDDLIFPLLHYCIICNVWDSKLESYNHHLKGKKHKRMAQNLSRVSEGKAETCFDTPSSEKLKVFSTVLNLCELCNIQFYESSSYNIHLQSKIHKRVEKFISIVFKEKVKEFIDMSSIVKVADKFGEESLSPSYHCKLCNIRCGGYTSYNNHLKGKFHVRIEQFLSKLSDAVSSFSSTEEASEILLRCSPLLHYCHICYMCYFGYKSYELHINSKIHQRKFKKPRKNLEHFNEKTPPYLCTLCKNQYSTLKSYNVHLMFKIHKRVENFLTKVPTVDADLILNERFFENYRQSPYHCGLCDVLCGKRNKSYEDHLKSKIHENVKRLVISAYIKNEKSEGNVCVEVSGTSSLLQGT